MKKMQKLGAGEILLTSMDSDGTKKGYDLDLTKKVSEAVNIPVIASGGVGNLEHLYQGFKIAKASAVLAASIFHFGKFSIKDAKKSIKEVISIISKSAPSTNLITSKLRKASRSLRKTSKDRSKSLSLINEAIKIFEMEVKWRALAEDKLFKQLSGYELKIRNSIGIRLQERLPVAMARKIASCQAVH